MPVAEQIARPATVDELLAKSPLEHTVEVVLERGGRPLAVRFRAIGRPAYEQLLDEHRPTEEQRARARREKVKCEWNPDTFPPAIIAACAVEPRFTVEQATALWESDAWGGEELLPLFFAATAVNTGRWLPGKADAETADPDSGTWIAAP